MAINAIIFDFFDVIHADPLNRWLKDIGRPREGEIQLASEDLDGGKITVEQFFERAAKDIGQTPEEVKAGFAAHTAVNYKLLELIGELKKQYKVGLLSNAPSEFLRGLLRTHEIEELFHHVAISSEVGMIKPNPEFFRHILEQLDVPADEAVFIDDNPKNVRAAETLGIHGVHYTDMPSLKRDLAALGINS